ncbi:MAG: rhodanese-like domain-containing protein [Acidiferrobacterales bacterium]
MYLEFLTENWYLFAALVVVLVMLGMTFLNQLIYKIKTVNAAQAIGLINREEAVVVDVCEPNEFQTGHLPNAINMPLTKLTNNIDTLNKHKGKPIVVTCRTGNRSMKGAITLKKGGFENVYSLSGGLTAWQKDNLPTER